METLVLEARDQVGGRVCTQACPGFSAPLDLGASIITGDFSTLPIPFFIFLFFHFSVLVVRIFWRLGTMWGDACAPRPAQASLPPWISVPP